MRPAGWRRVRIRRTQPDPRIWVLGPLCEGATFYNNLVPSPGVYSRPIADAHRCASAIGREYTPGEGTRLL